MSRSPRGRTTRFRVPFVLIVCLTTATAVASPTLVPPDAAAGLPRVVEVETASPFAAANADGLADACDAAFPPLSLNFTPPAPRSPSPWGEGPGVRGVPADSSAESPPPIAVQSVAEFAITSNGSPHPRPLARGRGEEMEGDSDSGLTAATFASPSLIELDALFADVTDQPPVVRAQSPEIDLLPLASGDLPLENTSILRAITGTKGRVRADYLTDFGGTDRIGVQMLTQAWYGIGLDVEANYWQRPVPDLGIEPLWTGDANLIYNFMPHPRFKFRSGLGAAWIVDDGDAAVGYNVTHGLDVYLLWRAMATGELEWGEIDSDKLFRYRLALGLTFDVCEVFTGYESYELGPERLDGWVNGIAFWY